MTPVLCESWNLTSLIVSRVHLAIHFLQSAFIAALKLITPGRMTPIADGLILAVTVLSTIWIFHPYLAVSPDPWGIAVVPIAGGILICSLWIARVTKRRAIPHELKAPSGEPFDSDPDQADPEIEIMVRLTDRGSGILGKRRCIVTIWYPIAAADIAEHGIEKSPNGDRRRYTDRDRKLPFWVKR